MSQTDVPDDRKRRNSFTWLIVEDVCKLLEESDQKISRSLVSLVVKHIFQNPSNGFNREEALDSEEVVRLVNMSREALMNDHGPEMEALRMQDIFSSTFKAASDIVMGHDRTLNSRIGPLMREIVNCSARTKQELTLLYSKIVTLVVLRSGLGNPTNAQVQREATAVLQTVFPSTNISRFLKQSPMDKRVELRDLSDIVTGVRIYNWDQKRGGAGVENLPAILSNALEASLDKFEATRLYGQEKIHKMTALVEAMTYSEQGMRATKERERVACKTVLLLLRQYQAFLASIIDEVYSCNQRLSQLDHDLLLNFTELQQNLANELTVPSQSVFPLFIQLAKTWKSFQDEMIVLSRMNVLQQHLQICANSQKKLKCKLIAEKLPSLEIRSDLERQSTPNGTIKLEESFECQILTAEEKSKAHNLEYNGFCPVAFVTGEGFILPGNPKVGVLRYQGKHYVCSNLDSCQQFARNPRLYISAIERLVYERPVFERLLVCSRSYRSQQEGADVELKEEAIQTPLHILNSYRDPKYEWNEWNMRRDVLRQTSRSCNLRGMGTQACLALEATNATGKKSLVVAIGDEGASSAKVTHRLIDPEDVNTPL